MQSRFEEETRAKVQRNATLKDKLLTMKEKLADLVEGWEVVQKEKEDEEEDKIVLPTCFIDYD